MSQGNRRGGGECVTRQQERRRRMCHNATGEARGMCHKATGEARRMCHNATGEAEENVSQRNRRGACYFIHMLQVAIMPDNTLIEFAHRLFKNACVIVKANFLVSTKHAHCRGQVSVTANNQTVLLFSLHFTQSLLSASPQRCLAKVHARIHCRLGQAD